MLGVLSAGSLAQAQAPLLSDAAPPTASPAADKPSCLAAACCPAPDCDGRFWVGGEYLLWWVKNGPQAAPLVTTGDPGTVGAGQLGTSTTSVLFGDKNINYGALSGARLAAGLWLNPEHTLGLESSGMWLMQKSVHFSAASDANGNPVLAFPTLTPDGSANTYYVAAPVGNGLGGGGTTIGPFAGSVTISSSTQLWGTELNAAWNVVRRDRLTADFLAGFRYLNLEEKLDSTVSTDGIGFDLPVLGIDHFATQNQFYGGQVGGRFGYSTGAFSLSATALVGLGATSQASNINGVTIVSGADALQPGTFPGFVYSQPTNMGHHTHSDFSVVPQVQLKGGYDMLPGVRVTIGYDFLYWTNVLRPGNQIDPVINVSQTAPDSFGGGLQLIGPARPEALAKTSNFWAQGVSFGVEFRW